MKSVAGISEHTPWIHTVTEGKWSMGNKALLIGVDSHELDPVLYPADDIQRLHYLKSILLAETEAFQDQDIIVLLNPDVQQMRQAIATFSLNVTHKQDLRLLYIATAGIIAPQTPFPTLYLAAYGSQPDCLGDSALSLDFLRGTLNSSHSDRQAVLFDCSWASTVTDGFNAQRPSPELTHLAYLPSAHRVILSHQPRRAASVELWETGATYLQLLTEGLTTQMADLDGDGMISTQDLHGYLEYEAADVQAPWHPVIYGDNPNVSLSLFKLPSFEPALEYRRSVEEAVTEDNGQISTLSRQVLDFLRDKLSLAVDQTQAIEADVLRPYQEKQYKLQEYQAVFLEAIQIESPPRRAIRRRLRYLQRFLNLSDRDVQLAETQALRYPHREEGLNGSRTTPLRLEAFEPIQSPESA